MSRPNEERKGRQGTIILEGDGGKESSTSQGTEGDDGARSSASGTSVRGGTSGSVSGRGVDGSTSASGGASRRVDGAAWSWGTSVERSRLVGCAARGGGDTSSVWHRADGAERLWWLRVGGDLTVGTGVDTWEVLVVTEAAQEGAIDIGGGGIVSATDTIEDVLAVVGSVSTSGVAGLQAELSTTHKRVPFDGLLVLSTIWSSTPRGGEEETTEGVTTLIGTVGIEFSSRIISSDIDILLGDPSSDLDVVGGLDELDTGQRAGGDDTSTIAGLCAPSDVFTLGVTNGAVWVWWTPEAEVVNSVDDTSLAHGGRALGGAVADVVSDLGTTITIVSVGLLWQVGPLEALGSKRNGRRRLSEDEGQKTRDECDGCCNGRHF